MFSSVAPSFHGIFQRQFACGSFFERKRFTEISADCYRGGVDIRKRSVRCADNGCHNKSVALLFDKVHFRGKHRVVDAERAGKFLVAGKRVG